MFGPQPASVAVDSDSVPTDCDVLAREAASDDIHQATPRLSIEGSHIVPDREWFEAPIVLPSHEDGPSRWLDFHGAHGAESAEKPAEYAAASACE
jgi:hypothetical protein